MPVLRIESKSSNDSSSMGAVNEMKAGKAQGLGGLSVFFEEKWYGHMTVRYLVRLLNKCFNIGPLPMDSCGAFILLVYRGTRNNYEVVTQ